MMSYVLNVISYVISSCGFICSLAPARAGSKAAPIRFKCTQVRIKCSCPSSPTSVCPLCLRNQVAVVYKSNCVVSEGVSKEGRESGYASARALQSAGARTPKALLSEWMWNSGVAKMSVDSKAVRSGASGTTLASRWLVADGAARVPGWINAESAVGRQGASKGGLAMSWLTTGVVPKIGGSGRIALPLAAAAAVAGVSYYGKELYAKGTRSAGLLVRRSSVEGPARLALKYV